MGKENKENKDPNRATFGWAVIYMTIKGIIGFYQNVYRDYRETRDNRDGH